MKLGGDVITKVNGRRVTRENDFSEQITRFEPGDTISLELYRGSERRTAQVTLGERPDKVSERADARGTWSSSWRSGLREHVLPFLGSHAGRAHVQAGAGGDVTFAIDEEAEAWLERSSPSTRPDVAFYSEDRGLVDAAPRVRIAGHRCSSSIRSTARGRRWRASSPAASPWPRRRWATASPRWATSTAACVAEIKTGAVFVPSGARDRSGARRRAEPRARTRTCRGCSGPSASAAARRCR